MDANTTRGPVSVYGAPQATFVPATPTPPEPAPPRGRRVRRAVWRTVGVLLLLAVVVTAAVLVPVHATLKDRWEPHRAETEPALSTSGSFGVMNVLLIGVDAREGETVARSDTLMLLRADLLDRKVWLVSIPRDSRVELPGYDGAHKVNAAHALGGPALAVEAVQGLLGVPIHHYAEIDFQGFQGLVDDLGGVTIDVPQEILDRQAATASEGGQAMHIAAGPQVLDGEHALTFARSRAYLDGDFTRMHNQQVLLRAIMKQATRPANLLRLPGAARGFSEYVLTDLGVPELSLIALAAGLAGGDGLSTATLTGTWQSPYVLIDQERRNELVTQMEDGVPFGILPSESSVTVLNGCAVAGCATEAASVLQAAGYPVEEVDNAPNSDFPSTLIAYHGEEYRPVAETVAAMLPGAQVDDEVGRFSFDTDILVIVGADWQGGGSGS